MKPTTLYNLVALAVALGLPLGWTVLGETRSMGGSSGGASATAEIASHVTDARGVKVEARHYARIVSASIVADPVLWRLCDPTRIAAYTSRATEHALHAHRYGGKPGVEGLRRIEEIVALRPDLVIISHFADPRHIARLEEAGIAVFDLGEMQGLETLQRNIEQIGALVGNPEGARRLSTHLRRGLDAVAAGLGDGPRPRALYLSIYGPKLFGGTRGTSYHDVLTAAGLVDAAAKTHSGWPELSAEEVLSIDPDLIVTKRGMGPAICRFPGLATLRACKRAGAIVGVTPILIDDPGPAVLESAQELFELVHGRDGAAARLR